MRKWTTVLAFSITMSMLAGCADDDNAANATPADEVREKAGTETASSEETDTTASEEKETSTNEASNGSESDNGDVEEDQNQLSEYSSKQIEFARVWLQLGPNQDVDELYVAQIPAGTKLDPDGDIDVTYPEDVIQITGSRLVDGIVTYSGNGDGTINIYEIPRQWYGGMAPPEELDEDKVREDMETILANKELVYVDTGDDEEVIRLIGKLQLP